MRTPTETHHRSLFSASSRVRARASRPTGCEVYPIVREVDLTEIFLAPLVGQRAEVGECALSLPGIRAASPQSLSF